MSRITALSCSVFRLKSMDPFFVQKQQYRNALPPNALHLKPEFWILMLHLTHFFFQIRCD
ncbi:hypothetical protein BpHYR1_019693 [Brachionus plicatilis]|uniref:Uncharacterized protein n=1 Tax=Brachionus plicatilis TaxID=10195 RepID=A0A3M7Q731_BRAPC|nr:hypothetical protein BpHYR1_019693 [Brachionus plicatilis]